MSRGRSRGRSRGGGSSSGGGGPVTSYEFERRSTGDFYLATAENWAPGGQWVVLAILEVDEIEGAGTILDFGWAGAGATTRAEIRAIEQAGNDALRLILRTGGTLTHNRTLGGEWSAQGKSLVFLRVDPANLTYRFGIGASGANESGATVVGSLPSASALSPVQVFQGRSLAANQVSGSIAFAALDTMPSDAQLDALAASPTAADLRALVDSMTGAGATLLLDMQTTDTAGVSTVTDGGSYTWGITPGSEPVHVAGTLPSYSLGAVYLTIAGQSNAEGSHSTSPPPMTLGTYTLSGNNGTDATASDYGLELGLIAVLDDWTTSIDVSQSGVGGSNIASWQNGGANWTAWLADIAAQGGTPTDIVWAHGESACIVEADALAYESDLQDWVDDVVAELGASIRIHVVALGSLPAGYPHRDTVAAAIEAVVAANSQCTLISVDGLTKVADNVHWDGNSMRAIGGRAALSIAQAMS